MDTAGLLGLLVTLATAIPAAPAPTNSGPISLSRSEIVKRLTDSIGLSPELASELDASQRTALIGRMVTAVENAGERVLPPEIKVSSPDRAQRILATNLIVSYSDEAYNHLSVERWVRGVNLGFSVERLVPPRSAEQRKALVQNIDATMAAVRESMVRRLAEKIPVDIIGKHVELRRETALAKIDDPLTYGFKRPMTAQEIDAIIQEFDRRLEASVDRVDPRLSMATQGADADAAASRRATIQRMILFEITTKVLAVLSSRTADPDLRAAIDLGRLDPEYAELVAKCSALEEQLFRERMRQEKQAQVESDRKRLAEELQQFDKYVAGPRIDEFGHESEISRLKIPTSQPSTRSAPRSAVSSVRALDNAQVNADTRWIWVGSVGLLGIGAAGSPSEAGIVCDAPSIDLGKLAKYAARNGEHTFVLYNGGSQPVRVLSYTVSCGCTSVTIPEDPVAPGSSARVTVRVDWANKVGKQRLSPIPHIKLHFRRPEARVWAVRTVDEGLAPGHEHRR